MAKQVLALSSNWLNATPTYAASDGVKATLSNQSNVSWQSQSQSIYGDNNYGGYYYRDYWYPYYYPVTITKEVEHKPIKLTLSEVERLRTLAKKDKEVKAILSKFTDQIEITVDF